jgi:hypothetical protein
MGEITIGIDIAKHVFQLHGAVLLRLQTRLSFRAKNASA